MKRIIELSENDYMALKEDGVQNHLALADTIIAHSVIYEERPQDCSDCKRYDSPYFEVKFDKEQMQELVDKAKSEVLASIERPQGEWIESHICSCGKILRMGMDVIEHKCKNCGRWSIKWARTIPDSFCSNCGAKIKKGGAE